MKMNAKELGKWGEKQAKAFLEKKGFVVVEQNFRCAAGEIDLIAQDGNWLVFIEVKTRRSINYGYPAEAVNFRKQGKYIQTALYYLKKNKRYSNNYRFDIVEVMQGYQGDFTINYICNAFQSSRQKYFF